MLALDMFLRQSIRSYPYHQSVLFSQLHRAVANVELVRISPSTDNYCAVDWCRDSLLSPRCCLASCSDYLVRKRSRYYRRVPSKHPWALARL